MRELGCFDMTHVLHSCQSCGHGRDDLATIPYLQPSDMRLGSIIAMR